MILSGRDGQVLWDPTGAGTTGLVVVAALNTWKANFKTEKIKVTCFGDANQVYTPGLPDVDGSVGGFWDSDELALFEAVRATAPGMLKLVPNKNEPTFYFLGKAYLDASIDTAVEGAPKVTGTIIPAGSWTGPEQGGSLLATEPQQRARR